MSHVPSELSLEAYSRVDSVELKLLAALRGILLETHVNLRCLEIVRKTRLRNMSMAEPEPCIGTPLHDV